MPCAWGVQVVQRSISLGAVQAWPPGMHSAPASPAFASPTYAYNQSYTGQTWQLQPVTSAAAYPWAQSLHHPAPHHTAPSFVPFTVAVPAAQSQLPQPRTQPGSPAGSYQPPLFPPQAPPPRPPPPPPMYIQMVSRPASSPAPLGISHASPEFSDRASQVRSTAAGHCKLSYHGTDALSHWPGVMACGSSC